MTKQSRHIRLALKSLDLWLRATQMAPSTLGQLSCANTRAVERVLAGTASMATLSAVLLYIEKNPPSRQR